MAKGKTIACGFVVGSIIGASATLLSAPSSGRDLRARVKKSSVEWKDITGNLVKNGISLTEQLTVTSKEGAVKIKEFSEGVKQSLTNWKESIEPHQKNINKYLEQIEVSLQELEDKVKDQ